MGAWRTGAAPTWWPTWLPQGGLLPEPVWRSRNTAVCALLAVHLVIIPVYGVLRGNSLAHSLFEATPVLCALLIASQPSVGRSVRASAAALGLMTCSGVLVHLSEGMIEAHFHFFAMIPVVALYEAWLPFAIGVGYVLVHHGVMGTMSPRSVYNHAAAWEHPWLFAGVHALLFACACAACLVNWWLHERARHAEADLVSSLAHSAEHDALTGLPGRSVLLRQGFGGAADGTASVMVLDLDGFKEVNDTLGHNAGDHLMEQVSRRLEAAVRSGDLLCRLGGDEFAVLMRDAGPEQAHELASGFLQVLTGDFVVDGTLLSVEATAGLATGSCGTVEDLATLLRRADVAMRDSKRNRRRITVYDPGSDHHTRERLTLMAELRRATERDELLLHFQPKISLGDRNTVGVEALVRWQHPRRGLLAPGSFIPAAEHTALIVPLTNWVIEAALEQARTWISQGQAVQVAVNIAPRCLLEPDFADHLLTALVRTGVPGHCLRLEITESTLLADPDRAQQALTRLSNAGLGLSIDDFGTGYSSMSYLRDLPIDELKIDRSFVTGMLAHREDAVLVQSAIDLGHNLGMSVVAEGVETEEVLEALAEAGCDVVQGYHVARPLAAEPVTEWLAARRLGVSVAASTPAAS